MSNRLDVLDLPDWREYLAIGFRRRWWILLPTLICWATVWGISWLLPATYASEALILVEQQKVPDQYVTPNVTLNLQDRLQSIRQQILSRTRLQETIDRFHLYSQPVGFSAFMRSWDPIKEMRNDIKIDLVSSGHSGEFSAFRVRYFAGSPYLAQEVNSELTSLFVDVNGQTQRQLSENTNTFLEHQLADARAKMEDQEARVAAFKAKHLGDLPAQLESNVQILAGLQAQLESTQRTLDASKQQRVYLQSLLQQYQLAAKDGGESAVSSTRIVDKELVNLQLRLEDLRTQYTDDYPEVAALKDKIAGLEKRKPHTEERISSTQKTSEAPTAAMMQVESQLKANQLEIVNGQEHERDLQSQIATYQARLNMTPKTEQALADISRGYEESKANYNSLLQKQMQSQLATSLEQRQQGAQFRIMDPPSLPARPSAPNRFRISLLGLALGFGLGLGLAAFLELTDVRVRQEKDLEGLVPARVLVGIPPLRTPQEDRSRLLTRWMELGAAVVLVMLVLAGNLYVFYRG